MSAPFRPAIIILLLAIGCGSCATILNGNLQKVPVRLPENTTLENAELYSSKSGDKYVLLRRDRDTTLSFYSGDHALKIPMERTLDGWILCVDIFPYFVPMMIDGWLQNWYYYKPIQIFDEPSGMYYANKPEVSLDTTTETPRKKIGVTLLAGIGGVGPVTQAVLFFNQYKAGIGYDILPTLGIYITAQGSSLIDLGIDSTWRLGNVRYVTYGAEFRYNIVNRAYVLGGGGITYLSNPDTVARLRIDRPKVTSLTLGIGMSWEVGYIEIYHTYGMKNIPISNGSIGRFEITTLNFGFNIKM